MTLTASGAAPATPGKAPRVASPIVRKLARETGVDVTAVTGTGPVSAPTGSSPRDAGAGGLHVPAAPVPLGEDAHHAPLGEHLLRDDERRLVGQRETKEKAWKSSQAGRVIN